MLDPLSGKQLSEYDLRLLRVFKAVVEHGGFAAAEHSLGITRSTISVHMSSLESRMNIKLCVRGRAGFALTERGQTVYQACLQLFSSIQEFASLVDNLGKPLTGELVILYSDLLDHRSIENIAKAVTAIKQQAPRLCISLNMESVANIESALINNQAHVGFYPAYRSIDGLLSEVVFSESIYLCASKQSPLFGTLDADIDPELLAKHAAIHPSIELNPKGRAQLQQLNFGAKGYQFDSRLALILSGAYIGYLPLSEAQPYIDQQTIRLIKPNEYSYPFELSLVHKVNPNEKQKVQLAMDALQTQFVTH
ncbi:LysR family transcriptional regulator [Agarivorans sp. B2Z047]|uniref:LysR family transcriptional regulator n=1 Tax=Agarivorans sp. B2Z047 TaxID=2652721 RepID=UPI00128B1BF1|nr:LysR family transcriptional regulator [Agarivorans sp. B2Z047]MPW30911.1 LysR family transcriptional regulator [Agarivorans sp. B2Z047]UQN40860.1 LysR family transcriptional regulator [Agarivorans sp. B2Z047]